MKRSMVLFGVLLLLVAGCEKKQEVQAPQSAAVQQESGTDSRPGQPGESPAESGQAPTVGEIREAHEETAASQEQTSATPAPESAAAPSAEQKAPEKKAEPPKAEPSKAEKQPKAAAEKAAPKAGSKGPETVVLANKNGDITFPHKAHQQLTDCKTCHGDKGAGKIGLDRDSGHKLCLGCHKEQGAGPTSCSGCHKKG